MLSLRKKGPNSADLIAWITSFAAELCILVASYYRFHGPHHVLRSVTQSKYDRRETPDRWDHIELGIAFTRVLLIALLACTYAFLYVKDKVENRDKFDVEGAGETADEST